MTSLRDIETFVDRNRDHCSHKELEFLSSASSFLERRGNLTPAQENWVSQIFEKYSEEYHLKNQIWKSNWSDEHREIATKVALYYDANPPYFSTYVDNILSNPENFTLSERQWNKFCENKYALKIRNIYNEELKFSKGDCVQIRKTNKILSINANYSGHIKTLAEKVGFIMKVDARPVTRAARGSRIYLLLVSGMSNPICVHESDIKRYRRKKHG